MNYTQEELLRQSRRVSTRDASFVETRGIEVTGIHSTALVVGGVRPSMRIRSNPRLIGPHRCLPIVNAENARLWRRANPSASSCRKNYAPLLSHKCAFSGKLDLRATTLCRDDRASLL
jgi:hypothetical protein